MNSWAKKLLATILVLSALTGVAYGYVINGQLVKAMFENLSSDPTGYEGRVYWNTSSDILKIYNGSSWLTMADNSATLTNPMTTANDMIVGGASGVVTRFATSLLGDIKATYGTFTFVDADVSTGSETITEASHGLVTGQTCYLLNSGGAIPGGLSVSTRYYVINASSSTIKLATSLANAIAGTPINITSAAGGGTHTLVWGGLVQTTAGIPGVTDASSATAGYPGELIAANSAGVTPAASGSFINVTSVSLSPGDWDVEGTCVLTPGSISALTRVSCNLSTTTNSFDSSATGGFAMDSSPGTTFTTYMPSGVRRFNVSATTTVYLVGRLSYTTLGTATWSTDSYMRARRVR